MNRRRAGRRGSGAALALAALAGCTAGTPEATAPTAAASSAITDPAGTASSDPPGTGAGTATSGTPDADLEGELRALLEAPVLPSFAIPTDLLTSAQDRDLASRLKVEPGLYEGIAVLGARCDAAGRARAVDAGASTSPGVGSFEDGPVSITVKADGTGVYDAPGIHVAVLAGGAGVYQDGSRRLSVQRGGAGTFEDGERRLTVRTDGSGSYEDGTVRLWVAPSGEGSYTDARRRVTVGADGVATGDAPPAELAAVGRVVGEGLPLFAPVPTIRRVAATGRACGTVIRLDANVLFAFGESTLRPDARALVERVGRLLAVVGPPAVVVNGHTDAVGPAAANLDLSTRRAQAVRAVLVAQREAGRTVDPGTVTVRGWGEREPLRPETTSSGADVPAARELNRRVEIVLPDR
ncbi:MAG TPA: OmpA family protein [Actinomycetales bacterium]